MPCCFAQIAEEQELKNKCKQEGKLGYKPKSTAGHSVGKASVSHKSSVWFSAQKKKKNTFSSSVI